MNPWMNSVDIRLIENALITQNKKHLSIFEWGAGGSTEYFTKFLVLNNISYDWISAEYNKKWYNKVKDLKISNVSLVLFDVGNDALKQRNTNMDDYVDYPLSINKKFDFVLIDGRKRRRCLEIASKIINDDGTVVLHDAERKYYHCAFNSFSSKKFLSKTLWIGSI